MSLTICPWKYDKQWVYSITYDEALVELDRFAIPYHEEYRIPGHVEVVVGQLGQVRKIGQSTYNGFHHMDGSQLKDLIARGWGVGNHSWTHEVITPDTVAEEIGRAKQVLEKAIGSPVLLYCSPGNNTNMADHVLDACRQYGYLGAMSLTDALNLPQDELFWLNRTALHDQYYEPFYSAFDPYRNIRFAQERQGWIIDYCHCPLEEPVHRNKDCSQDQLRQRFEAVLQEGGDRVWCAVPEEVLSYHLLRRHARVEEIRENQYSIDLDTLPEAVPYRDLTVEITAPPALCRQPRIRVDDRVYPATLVRPGVLQLTMAMGTVTEIGVIEA
ncbi:MAG: polysaccharide deacetylase family protein [Candidatus Latescibacteria bacterium]|nr:polysaccharide deacetylase family protein [Candidatus Latescibacterota bacterium]